MMMIGVCQITTMKHDLFQKSLYQRTLKTNIHNPSNRKKIGLNPNQIQKKTY